MVKYKIKWERNQNDVQLWLKNTNDPVLSAIADNYVQSNDSKKLHNMKLNTGKYAKFVSLKSNGIIDGTIQLDDQSKANMRILPDCLGIFYTSIGFQKDSPFTEYFDKRIRLYLQNGLYKHWMEMIERKPNYHWMKNLKSLYSEPIHERITMRKLEGSFYLLLLGQCLAMLCFLIEIFSVKYPSIRSLLEKLG